MAYNKMKDWLKPKSIITGVAITLATMIIPAVRNTVVKYTTKVSDKLGLN